MSFKSLATAYQKGSCEVMEWKRDDENGARCLDEEVNIQTLIS